MRDRGLHQADRGQLVRVDRGEHLRILHVEGARRWRTTRVRDQDVDASEPFDGRRDEARGRVGLGDVRGDRQDLAGELGRGGLEALRAPGADHHPSAVGRQRSGDAATESLRRAGDQRDLPRHPEVHRGASYGGRTESAAARTLVTMSFRRILPRVVALAAVAALVVTLFVAADGREPGPAAPVLRQRSEHRTRSRAWACG